MTANPLDALSARTMLACAIALLENDEPRLALTSLRNALASLSPPPEADEPVACDDKAVAEQDATSMTDRLYAEIRSNRYGNPLAAALSLCVTLEQMLSSPATPAVDEAQECEAFEKWWSSKKRTGIGFGDYSYKWSREAWLARARGARGRG